MAEVKFCGLTRPEDAAVALEQGARYAGVIFAGGPRLVDEARAREVFAPLRGTDVGRVGVFGAQPLEEILRVAHAARVDVVQLHGGATADGVRAVRERFSGGIWVVLRLRSGTSWPSEAPELAADADALVLDAAVDGQLGGTGVSLDWPSLHRAVQGVRRGGLRVVLAGGLRPESVASAVRIVQPDVVDVSSGVESAPGIKDHGRMRAFAQAVHSIIE